VACASEAPRSLAAPAIGQWIWTRADLSRYAESAPLAPGLQAGVYIGSIHCDSTTGTLLANAGLSPAAAGTAAFASVIRFEAGLDNCRSAHDTAMTFNVSLDSVVHVLRSRGGSVPVREVQLDYDAPQRALGAWAASVKFLGTHALATDSVWVTSLIAHLREPDYGDMFRGVVRGHVLQVFDTGEAAGAAQVDEAIRLAARARMPFRVGLGAFERDTRNGRTDHRAWFATVPRFAAVNGYRGIWIFPAGLRWISLLREAA
jgi:hypothetical protein